MSYIEREAVNALIESECSPKVAAYLNHAIDNIPAADVRPVVRGEWSLLFPIICDRPYCYECTNCGFATERRTNFCPNCGADMRGEAE